MRSPPQGFSDSSLDPVKLCRPVTVCWLLLYGWRRGSKKAMLMQVFHFPAVNHRHVVVEVFEKLGSAQVRVLFFLSSRTRSIALEWLLPEGISSPQGDEEGEVNGFEGKGEGAVTLSPPGELV